MSRDTYPCLSFAEMAELNEKYPGTYDLGRALISRSSLLLAGYTIELFEMFPDEEEP